MFSLGKCATSRAAFPASSRSLAAWFSTSCCFPAGDVRRASRIACSTDTKNLSSITPLRSQGFLNIRCPSANEYESVPKRAKANQRGTLIERQRSMRVEQILHRLPRQCAILTGANVHDATVVIPMMKMSAESVIWLYDVMDSSLMPTLSWSNPEAWIMCR